MNLLYIIYLILMLFMERLFKLLTTRRERIIYITIFYSRVIYLSIVVLFYFYTVVYRYIQLQRVIVNGEIFNFGK